MATEDSTAFGRISRTKDVAFEYLTLGATLFGIVALGVLLAYVAVDAVGRLAGSYYDAVGNRFRMERPD